MKIATWNVNSITVRLPQVLEWLTTHSPDILALQETKVQDPSFPVAALLSCGYQASFIGEKSYNGVAILSKTSPRDILTRLPHFDDPQCRFLSAMIEGYRVVNLYVPNGAQVGSEKYIYKLAWLDAVIAYVEHEQSQGHPLVVLGDFNIAPKDEDVHDPAAWSGQVLVSEKEREKWTQLLSLGLYDAYRLFHQGPGRYSWWDYRMNAFVRNHGLRIDHILINEMLKPACQQVEIDAMPRTFERPSDHAPVMAVFK